MNSGSYNMTHISRITSHKVFSLGIMDVRTNSDWPGLSSRLKSGRETSGQTVVELNFAKNEIPI